MSISDNLKKNKISHNPDDVLILRLSDGTESKFFWDQLSRVIAYKIDLFSYDQVCVCFETIEGNNFEISEDDDGFNDLMRVAPRILKGFSVLDRWKPSIVSEPFERSETILWLASNKTSAEQNNGTDA